MLRTPPSRPSNNNKKKVTRFIYWKSAQISLWTWAKQVQRGKYDWLHNSKYLWDNNINTKTSTVTGANIYWGLVDPNANRVRQILWCFTDTETEAQKVLELAQGLKAGRQRSRDWNPDFCLENVLNTMW